ncbi:hypothetical protein VMCG_03203 [Cytospora schulzeri]|uniref:Complex 1 LYR protein domain-containing protein n=1 Tax=Cytospora schulzeri TaxID=448051 RepID=A0A423WXR8_9PEZI|nr:hypothetical protein VMCG_03203 [Valsa malicola]
MVDPRFALYRALLRQVPRISLPDDLTSRPGWINPIQFLIRSSFRRNKNDTSPRLVTSALKSGYRFLTLLTEAHEPSNTQHASVVSFLRDRQSRFPPADQPKRVEPETKSIRYAELPLLTKVSGPGERPVYGSTFRPRPLAELSGGTRRIPVLEEANGGIPFLRIGKPQSHYLGSYIQRKGARRQHQVSLLQQLSEEAKSDAQEEDMWEDELARLADEEGVELEGYGGGVPERRGAGSYEHSVKVSMEYVAQRLNNEVEDMKARAVAMLDIVDEEKRLAAEEEMERKRMKRWERNVRRRTKPRGRQRDREGREASGDQEREQEEED